MMALLAFLVFLAASIGVGRRIIRLLEAHKEEPTSSSNPSDVCEDFEFHDLFNATMQKWREVPVSPQCLFRGFGFEEEAVVVDVETTGLNPADDRILSVAMMRMGNHSEPETMYELVNPGRDIPVEASCIHGIFPKDVAQKSSFADNARQFRDFIGDRPIIGHNVQFDKKFLSAEFKRSGVKTLARNKSYCTMERFLAFNLDEKATLDNVAYVMGLARRKDERHDALEDVNITLQIAALFYAIDNDIRI